MAAGCRIQQEIGGARVLWVRIDDEVSFWKAGVLGLRSCKNRRGSCCQPTCKEKKKGQREDFEMNREEIK